MGTKEIVKAVVTKEDYAFIEGNLSMIENICNKAQVFRTETEMRISVLNDIKHPTLASKYWQSVREMKVQYTNLVTLSFDYRRNRIERLKLEKKIASENDELDKELLEIDLEEKQFGQANMESVAKDRMREIRLWLKIMGECVEGDPNFDTENVNTHQLLSYGLRFEEQMKNIGNASPSEKANLAGQHQTATRHMLEKGLLKIDKTGVLSLVESS